MELLCPQCQQKLTIPDQYAGQVMRCPLCNGTFTAPTMAAPPPPIPVAPPVAPPPAPPPPLVSAPPLSPHGTPGPVPEAPVLEKKTPLPPGDYTRSCQIWISPRIVPWIPPLGLFLVLLLTVFPWSILQGNAWVLGFGGERSDPIIGMYLIFLLLAFFAAIPSALFAMNLVPAPPVIQNLGPWRPVIVGGMALVGFLLLAFKYLDAILSLSLTPGTIWFKLACRVHFVVVIAVLLEIWLAFRRRKNLPLPRIEVHW